MTKEQAMLLKFMIKYPRWHTILTEDRVATRNAKRFVELGILQRSGNDQYRLLDKEYL